MLFARNNKQGAAPLPTSHSDCQMCEHYQICLLWNGPLRILNPDSTLVTFFYIQPLNSLQENFEYKTKQKRKKEKKTNREAKCGFLLKYFLISHKHGGPLEDILQVLP